MPSPIVVHGQEVNNIARTRIRNSLLRNKGKDEAIPGRFLLERNNDESILHRKWH